MKKIEALSGEEFVIKSADGTEYVYNEEGLHEVTGEPQLKVLKSMRTEAGAKDWVRISGKKDAKIMDTTTLKSMHYEGEYMESMPYHVVVEDVVEPILNAIEEDDFESIIKSMMDAGYIDIADVGPCMTEKWYSSVDSLVRNALKDALKSTAEVEDLDNLSETEKMFFQAAHTVVKALEDSEALARMTGAPENATTGHERRPEESVSDADVKTAEQREADQARPGDVTDTSDPNMEGEELSDETVREATYIGDHNSGEDRVTYEDMTVKSATEEDEVLNTVFKSLSDARAWVNPQPEKYHVVPTDFYDKQKYGRNKSYIVKEREPKVVTGAHGNRLA